jgi:hypothetical protein
MPTQISASHEWYCKVFGTELGPLPVDAVRRMVETEQLTAEDLVRRRSSGPWRTVREIADLRMLLKQDGEARGSIGVADSPQSDEPPDEWYYQLDGRTHGPLTLGALVNLIGSSGETAHDVVVRQGPDGTWAPFNSLPGIGSSSASATAICKRGDQSAGTAFPTTVGRGVTPRHTIREFIRDNRELAIVVAVWLGINGALLVAWTQSYATERKYFATLRSLEAESKELQTGSATAQDWKAFRDRVKRTLAPMVADLKRRASASEPIRQHLLWAARDQFPKCAQPGTRENSESERLYQRHMQVVEQELARQ